VIALRIMGGALALCVATTATAQDVRFVACPIYRDTNYHESNPDHHGRRTGCWLVDDPETGIRYDVNDSWSKPDFAYGVLVEGDIKEGAEDTCGGIQLGPVRTSILYDRECPRRSLMAEGYTSRPPLFSERYVMPGFVERDLPDPPYRTMTFSPTFDFDSAFMTFNLSDYALDQAIYYYRQVGADNVSKVIVTGWAATEPEVISGVTLAERLEVAQERVDGIVTTLLRMGIPEDRIETHAYGNAEVSDTEYADGLEETSRRRADITVVVD